MVIKRRNLIQDAVRSYTVFIGDAAVGKMWAFQTKTFAVSPGHHDVQLRIINIGRSCSDVFRVKVTPGGRIVLRTQSRGVKKALTYPLLILQGGSALARGQKIESKYGPWIRMALED